MRSNWKIPFIIPGFLKKRYINKKLPRIKVRNSLIPFTWCDKKVIVHNGSKKYKAAIISPEHMGLRFGDLSLTKTSVKFVHLKKNKGKKKPKKSKRR